MTKLKKWKLEHEMDNEPSYIWAPGQDADLAYEEPAITVAPGNYTLAYLIAQFLNMGGVLRRTDDITHQILDKSQSED